jgi:hypothetical protein
VMARRAGEPYRLEIRGKLAGLIGDPGGAARSPPMSAKLVVPVERIELPTFGLQNLTRLRSRKSNKACAAAETSFMPAP